MGFEYTSGRPSLDLVGTVSERGTTDLERLRSWADVEAWVGGSGLRVDDLTGDDADLPRVRALREALHAVVRAGLDGVPVPSEDARVLNEAAAGPPLRPALAPGGTVRWSGGLDAVLATLARDGLELVGSGEMALVRGCDDPACTRLYVDRSRGGRRRWCGMKGCGDRAKAAAYRQRHRSPAS